LNDNVIFEQYGKADDTTNNRMELLGVIRALQYIKKEKSAKNNIIIRTDSRYVQKGITEWMGIWKANNWKTKNGQEVKNLQFWKRLDKIISEHIVFEWVHGHSGNKYNERADKLAKKYM